MSNKKAFCLPISSTKTQKTHRYLAAGVWLASRETLAAYTELVPHRYLAVVSSVPSCLLSCCLHCPCKAVLEAVAALRKKLRNSPQSFHYVLCPFPALGSSGWWSRGSSFCNSYRFSPGHWIPSSECYHIWDYLLKSYFYYILRQNWHLTLLTAKNKPTKSYFGDRRKCEMQALQWEQLLLKACASQRNDHHLTPMSEQKKTLLQLVQS